MTVVVQLDPEFNDQTMSNRELLRIPETPNLEREAIVLVTLASETTNSSGVLGNTADFSRLRFSKEIYNFEVMNGASTLWKYVVTDSSDLSAVEFTLYEQPDTVAASETGITETLTIIIRGR